jgi:hypothetical protein
MSHGFVALDDEQLQILESKPKQKLYLLRLPKDIDITTLQGAQLRLDLLDTDQDIESGVNDITHSTLCIESDTSMATLRPLAQDSITSHSGVGPAFDGVVSGKTVYPFPKTAGKKVCIVYICMYE